MRKLYENFHIFHFQKRIVSAETIRGNMVLFSRWRNDSWYSTGHFRHTSKGMDTLERAWFVAWCAKRIGLARLVCRFSWGKKWCINHNCMVIKVLALGKTLVFRVCSQNMELSRSCTKEARNVCSSFLYYCVRVSLYILCSKKLLSKCVVWSLWWFFLQCHLNADPLKRWTRPAIVLILILSKIKQCYMTKTFLFLS